MPNYSALRKLVPRSYSIDAYNIVGSRASNEPFFANGVVTIGNYAITKKLADNTLRVSLQSPCSTGVIKIEDVVITLDCFAELLTEECKKDGDFIYFRVPVSGSKSCSSSICRNNNPDCLSLRNHKNTTVGVSFNLSEVKAALAVYHGISNEPSMDERRNNMFGNKKLFNVEFGKLNNNNIRSTMLGVAVRDPKTDKWYSYDAATGTIKDVSLFGEKMGNFPILVLPVNQVNPGDLIKYGDSFYYVQSVNGNQFTGVNPQTQDIDTKILAQSMISGLTFYSKVVAMDMKTFQDATSGQGLGGNMMAAFFLMQMADGGEGKATFSLDNLTNDSCNGLGEFLLMSQLAGNNGGAIGGSMNGLNPMVLMSLMNDGGDAVQAMIISTLLNGGSMNDVFNGMINPATNPTSAPTGEEPTVYCPQCNEKYDSSVKFCPRCGVEVQPIAKPGKTCRKCGATLTDGAAFCHMCGTPVTNKCPWCGSEVPDEANFCSKCGHKLDRPCPATPNVAVPDTKTATVKKPKKPQATKTAPNEPAGK